MVYIHKKGESAMKHLEKTESYFEQNTNVYPDSIREVYSELIETVSNLEQENIIRLVNMCYKEGFKDGYRLADYLHEETR